MSIPVYLQRVNRHGVTCAAFLGLLIVCGMAHSLAVSLIGLFVDIPAAYLPGHFLRNVVGIRFIETNWRFLLAYLLMVFGSLLYMELRSTPRWAVWTTFLFLSLPALAYVNLCISLGIGFVTIVPSASP